MTLLRTGFQMGGDISTSGAYPGKATHAQDGCSFRLNLSELILRGRPLAGITHITLFASGATGGEGHMARCRGEGSCFSRTAATGENNKSRFARINAAGYYSLKVRLPTTTSFLQSQDGIVVLPDNSPLELSRDAQDGRFFGMTHHDIGDRILGATWIKTVKLRGLLQQG